MGNTSGNCQPRKGLLNSAPCSVLISRGRGRGAPRERARGLRVFLAVDESEHAVAAARLLRALNVPATSQVTVRGLTVHPLLVEGRPAEEIIRAAERTHADLVLF